ncbi:uncharacterized protein si:ch73-173p19.1 [Polypterus senegalus]|uniref:uncharacterized protein si:ch73-173p19.1 n=1 Tax=Polypterus senegalus TaxID=55291 RepID=UPI0019649149|nr:uncharacterized protein si:ch73-173p19.1 [Polypterus senegalus]XP_039609156.1 uncharacterized protein si:ch73-173p19.1 [Polypterus senegalus]
MESSQTISSFFNTLAEMGFTDVQIQEAIQAGHFTVPEATDWMLQAADRRCRLERPTQPEQSKAISAFNPPVDLEDNHNTFNKEAEKGSNQPSSFINVPMASRSRLSKTGFDEQQRERATQDALNEKKMKQKQRELALKRIADDRKMLEEKLKPAIEPTDKASKLGGRIQTAMENICILNIRLPSGTSMRERFPADAPLKCVIEHISACHPSLSKFSLIQGFPRKHFGEAELSCSLRALGLTPNAALCVQSISTNPSIESICCDDLPKGAYSLSQEVTQASIPEDNKKETVSQSSTNNYGWGRGETLGDARSVLEHNPQEQENMPPLPPSALPVSLWNEAIANAGLEGNFQQLPLQPYHWGRGQRLDAGDDHSSSSEGHQSGEESGDDDNPLFAGLPQLPFIPRNRQQDLNDLPYQWPDHGNRLRGDDEIVVENEAHPSQGADLQDILAHAAMERLHQVPQLGEAHSCELPSPPKRSFKAPSLPSLSKLATKATVYLMTAPSMQYNSSLARLTPELAEHLLTYLARERLLRPRTLEYFFGCQIQKFVLNCYPYSTNELLRQLRAFQTLKHLSLVSSPLLTDSGMSFLPSLQKLQHLNLSACCKLTDNCLQYIKGLRFLSYLSLDKTKVSDCGLVVYLESAPASLTQLSLNCTNITEKTLAVLPCSVPQLKLLSIKHTKIFDISALKGMLCLHTLHIDHTCVSETSLLHLAAHPSLSVLGLAGIPVNNGNHVLEIVSGLKLSHLTLTGRHTVTDSGLEFLARLTFLSEVDLTDYTEVTDQGVQYLATLSRLKKLSLSNTMVTDAGLSNLARLLELVELCLDRTAVTSKGVARCVMRLPHLQVLGLANTQVGDNLLKLGLIHCQQLVKINLSHTRITDKGLKYLRLIKLTQVNLDNTGITPAGLSNLISSCPDITNIRAKNLQVLPQDQISDDEASQ